MNIKLPFIRVSTGIVMLFLGVIQIASLLSASDLVRGADISWLPEMEASGFKFYADDGTPRDCLLLLRFYGINTIRLRVFVHPSQDPINGHCSRNEVVSLASRAQKLGFRILIDFHYSDTWADPGHQAKPAAWVHHGFEELKRDVAYHTCDVLTSLKKAAVKPEWVQVGNEITQGMLWPDGKLNHGSNLAELISAGYTSTKSVFPRAKVIVHLDRGQNGKYYRTYFDTLERYGARYDVIGMSYYPFWTHDNFTKSINDLGRNLIDMASHYKKEVMVVETGGEETEPEKTEQMLSAVFDKVRAVPEGKGLGVVYWEPEGAANFSKYQLSSCGDDGKFTRALDAFSRFQDSIYH